MNTEAEILRLKQKYGSRLVILAHYYQRDEVFRLADFSGDSYQLALEASRSRAEHIVFCGVSFMAESARMLARPDQRVYLPDAEAGCPLADMADPAEVAEAIEEWRGAGGGEITPVLYINSSVAVKAVCARAGGIVCTSSNVLLITRSLLQEAKRVFFLPDKNLGLDTAGRIPLPEDEVAIRPRKKPRPPANARTRMLVWDGFCNVHVKFSAADALRAKNEYPYARILVHPECPPEVTALADFTGSTSAIIREVERAPAGTVLFIGTELNLVQRLARSRTDLKVFPLRNSGCVNMNKITLEKLLATIQSIDQPKSTYEVFVPEEERAPAVQALRRMIERVGAGREKP